MLEQKLLTRLEGHLHREGLPVAIRLWNGKRLSAGEAPRVTVSFNSPRALSLLARPSLGKLAEGYVRGQIDVQGDIRDVVSLMARLCGSESRVRRTYRDSWRFWRHGRRRDSRAVRSHYDVSDEFYALWLDRLRVYSCGYFRTPGDSLDLAQEQKLDHICRKLALRPGERFLDIGCGWGALIVWAAQRYGARAVGITLSENQYRHVRRQVADLGVSDRVEVRLQDYRDVPEDEPFDKIASVGMFEHVGLRRLPVYFRKIHALLRPGGLALNHGITSATFDGETIAGDERDFINRYVFPDGELTHVSKVLEVASRQGLECVDVESLRLHYARTLWHWVERLDARQEEARALVGEQKYRVWRAYMGGFAYAFERGWDSIHQILAAKPLENGAVDYPFTRDYMYA